MSRLTVLCFYVFSNFLILILPILPPSSFFSLCFFSSLTSISPPFLPIPFSFPTFPIHFLSLISPSFSLPFIVRIIDCALFIPAFHSASCAAIRAGPSNNAVSGKHFIDVDGMGPLPKVEVECYFKSQSVETVVKTKLASEVPVEDISGQKRVNIPYTADKRSIRSITMQSQQCSQHVKYVCTKSALFQSPKGPPQVSIDVGMHFFIPDDITRLA